MKLSKKQMELLKAIKEHGKVELYRQWGGGMKMFRPNGFAMNTFLALVKRDCLKKTVDGWREQTWDLTGAAEALLEEAE